MKYFRILAYNCSCNYENWKTTSDDLSMLWNK